jgi:hypothetical protein
MLIQMNIDPNSPFFKDVPRVTPEKTLWDKIRAFFSPQVNAVIVTSFLALGPTGYTAYTKGEKVHELELKIIGLTTENTGLKNEHATYASIPERVPKLIAELEDLLANDPTNRLQLASIKSSLEIVTKVIEEMQMRPTFGLWLNDQRDVTNNTSLDLRNSRKIQVAVENTSNFTASQLSVDFSVPPGIAETNIIAAAGWEIGAGPLDPSDKKTKIGTHFHWTANKALGPHQFWNMPLLEISTNVTGFPVIGAEIRVYADRSESTEFRIGLVFQ